ncbi:MAG: hypothetical protein Q8K98_12295 [Bacteroidota bacterium]|nr:hypothetical protein [Bacteroidota bacterium]
MARKDYIPYQDPDFVVWLENFSKKIANYTTTLNVTDDEVTAFQNYYNETLKLLNDVQAMKTSLQSIVETKTKIFDEAEKKVRDKAVIIKRHPNYNVSIGEDLGIVPPATGLGKSISIDQQKPVFSIAVLPDKIRLDWVKGEFDGVVIQSKRAAETSYMPLDKDTKSPYEDARPNITPDIHEARIYRMRYILDDKEAGQWSDEMKIYCML